MPLLWCWHKALPQAGRKPHPVVEADGKAQVTVLYQDDAPVAVSAVVVSVQHEKDAEIETIRREIKEITRKVIPEKYLRPGTRLLINPSGRFVLGGPAADTGLTGRKLAVTLTAPWRTSAAGVFRERTAPR